MDQSSGNLGELMIQMKPKDTHGRVSSGSLSRPLSTTVEKGMGEAPAGQYLAALPVIGSSINLIKKIPHWHMLRHLS